MSLRIIKKVEQDFLHVLFKANARGKCALKFVCYGPLVFSDAASDQPKYLKF